MSTSIYLTAVMYPAPGKAEEIKSRLNTMIPTVHDTEPTTLQYEIYTSKTPEGDDVVIAHETYANQAAIDSHSQTDLLKDFQKFMAEEGTFKQPPLIYFAEKYGGFRR
ncbi:hypothetical protein BS50DRAFT_677066 [Corynespora cassiicola Philippines]|uniref:ABM domain-containing protein n=1 Tax=Corynespora cassiicola Philippines TaxID=1448308 RepID=A0A2T2NQ63_CORCC|nr:hypothetical protein BS50DRAFT_677066 [Corynespora cassiicola Philippines]